MEDDGHLMQGRASAVSYGGAILTGEKNMKAADKKHMIEMDQIIAELGWEVLKYMGVGPNRKSQVVIIPSKDMGEMPAKVNEDIVLEVVYKEGKKIIHLDQTGCLLVWLKEKDEAHTQKTK